MTLLPTLSVVTLGVRDLRRSIRFYRDVLGWRTEARVSDPIAFFPLRSVVLALYPWRQLAQDARVPAKGSGFTRVTLAHNTRTRAEVDRIFERLRRRKVRVLKAPQKAVWGGYSGYFADPDGHAWEVVYNPYWRLDRSGAVVMSAK